MKAVKDLLSNQSRLPNSGVPKEVAYETKIIHMGDTDKNLLFLFK